MIEYWNVLTIDLITRTEEQESIRNLGNIFNSPWDTHTRGIAGKAHSLNHIEHDTIRSMNEPRFILPSIARQIHAPTYEQKPIAQTNSMPNWKIRRY